MESYKDEARPDPHPRSPEVLKALAKVRGAESGNFFAEAFMAFNSSLLFLKYPKLVNKFNAKSK